MLDGTSRVRDTGSVSKLTPRHRFSIRVAAHSMLLLWGTFIQPGFCRAVEPRVMRGTISRLQALEQQFSTVGLVEGEPRCAGITEYYWDANRELELELNAAKKNFEACEPDHHRMTLVAGPAGLGKTFIKRDFCAGVPVGALWKFDVRELFQHYCEQGMAEQTADLHDGTTVFNHMLSLTSVGRKQFRSDVLNSQASFVVVDSLDEIHPKDYVFVLQTLEEFLRRSERAFAQVVVFGRPFSFVTYWHQRDANRYQDIVHGFILRKPEFRTDGDIQVSNWNFDSWKFGLRRGSAQANAEVTFAEYQAWCERGYGCDGEFSDMIFDPNDHMKVEVRATLERWISEEPTVAAVISNLAANGMVRDILVDQLRAGEEFDERTFMDQFLTRWLERDTKSDDRPSLIKPTHLHAYLGLLENVAASYSSSVKADGTFSVPSDANVKIELNGGDVMVSVKGLLNRSGLVTVQPFGKATNEYRFEPFWLHRFLTGRYVRRLSGAEVRQSPVALRLP